MRKVTVIILLPIFLFGAVMPLQAKEDFARLPVLIKHFAKHRTEYSDLTFCAFLKLHYEKKAFSAHQSTHDHSNLPLKVPADHLHAPAQMEMISPFPVVPFYSVKPDYARPFHLGKAYSLIRYADIWQPPK